METRGYGLGLRRSVGGQRRGQRLLSSPTSIGVISAQHGAGQQEEVESGLPLRLKVKYVSENNVNGFLRQQIHGYFQQLC